MNLFKNKIWLGVAVVAVFFSATMVFQNCSRATFSERPTDGGTVNPVCTSSQQLINGKCVEIPNNCASNQQLINGVCQNVCPAGQEKYNGSCVAACKADEQRINGTCAQFACKQFVDLGPGPILNVPARDFNTGICYYSKVLNHVPGGNADEAKSPRLAGVLARHHYPTGPYPDLNIVPFLMAEKSLQLKLSGPRAMKLSGSSGAVDSTIRVDNFILIRMNGDKIIKALGTQDSTVVTNQNVADKDANGKEYIIFNGQKIPFIGFEPGGFAHVAPVSLSEGFPVGVQSDMKFHALNCGMWGEIDDTYVVFQ